MPPRLKRAAKSRVSSRSSNSRNTTRRKRMRISREELESSDTPNMLESLLTDPDCNSIWESVDRRSNHDPPGTNNHSQLRKPTSGRLRRCTSFFESSADTQGSTSPSGRRSRVSRKQGLENIEMSLLSQTGQTDWLLPRGSTGSVNPGLMSNIKTRLPSGSSQEVADDFCWICHRSGQLRSCGSCPRVYHRLCLSPSEVEVEQSDEVLWCESWQCPLCRELAFVASDVSSASKWKPVTTNATYEDQLKKALAFMVDFMSTQSWAESFRESVDCDENIRYPMDLRTLLQRVNDGRYKSTKAFLADFLWIIHNCLVANEDPNSQLRVKARSLEQMCLCEIELLQACPTCYLNRTVALFVLPSTAFVFPAISKCEQRIYRRPEMRKSIDQRNNDLTDKLWFAKLCSVIHPIVWVRFEEGRRWSGKMMAELPNGLLLISFFGTYITRRTPTNYVTLHTCLGTSVHPSYDADITIASCENDADGGLRRLPDSGESWDAETYTRAVKELQHHLSLIFYAFTKFQLPAAPASRILPFSKQLVKRYYGPFNQWARVGDSLPSPSSSDPNASAIHTGDKVDFMQTSESLHIPLPSFATTSPLSLPPAPSPHQTFAPTALTPTPPPPQLSLSLDGPFTVDGSSLPPTLNNLSEPRLRRLSTTLSSSFSRGSLESRRKSQCKPPSIISETEGEDDRSFECNSSMLRNHFMAEHGDISHAETNPSTDSTSSTFPLRIVENVPADDFKANLMARFQDARDAFSNELQSLVETAFHNLEESINETYFTSTAAAVTEASAIPVLNRETQTPANAVLPMQFLADNRTKVALMRMEVLRQSQELERLRLMLDYTRYEVASSQYDRLAELRAVWEAELQAVVEGVVKLCEQEVSKIIDSVKRKQWCTYCGNEAFFYCCWNTVYCNTTCQQLHWPEHMSCCTHPKRQVMQESQSQPSASK